MIKLGGYVALCLVTAVAAGDTIHFVGHRIDIPMTHHAFHLLFTTAALVIFAGFVMWDVRRRGWPRFSWRL
ncbi:MAG TPA: hypothetical protein VNA65_11445 [Candidatus Dormibacteraeota bacterium]|nr:hypothetical protein [Candidatus Dormibacteraeota bacterium]